MPHNKRRGRFNPYGRAYKDVYATSSKPTSKRTKPKTHEEEYEKLRRGAESIGKVFSSKSTQNREAGKGALYKARTNEMRQRSRMKKKALKRAVSKAYPSVKRKQK